MKLIQIPATITRIGTTADNGISLTIRSQELSPEMKLIVMEMHNAFGWFMFRENKFSDEEVPKEEAVESKNKSVSQRKRSVMFIYWKQNRIADDFDVWYKKQMELEIEQWKQLLE